MAEEEVKGSGRAPDDAGKFRVVHGSARTKNLELGLPVNAVKNTKYTPWNFLFKNLAEQFSLHINRYFLIIAFLQLIPILTPVAPITTWGPLAVIFGITAAKELSDDIGRYREDEKTNSRLVMVVVNGREQLVPSAEIHVGDVVKVEETQEFPCDLLLLQSSSKKGTVYVQTTNLDGETNYKHRQVLPDTLKLPLATIQNFNGVVECPTPNDKVYEYNARLWLGPSPDTNAPRDDPISVGGDQLLQQATKLVNTEWIYGMAVYTGNQTKFGMTRGDPPFKYTKVDKFVNTVAIIIFCFQLFLVVIFGIVGDVRRFGPSKDHWYVGYDLTPNEWYTWLIMPGRFLLLNSTMIPISLKVTLDFCKLIYSRLINYDRTMYHAASGEFARANNTSISEDLGQIQYILTDKTGTLTQNVMVFKQCAVGTRTFDAMACEAGGRLEQLAREEKGVELDLLRHFALNSSVVPAKDPAGRLKYKGSSPDEVALVEAAARLGVKLLLREGQNVTLDVHGQKEQYCIQAELKFDSDRKRMSVAVLNVDTKKLRLYCKGADDVLAGLVRPDEVDNCKAVQQRVEDFAMLGLRTLFFASREVAAEEFAEWQKTFYRANTAMEERKLRLREAYALLETNFLVQGCSAIEDKLQDGVSEAIKQLRLGGIRIWMLTGDKFSTALQIATSCNLKSDGPRSLLCALEGNSSQIGDTLLKCDRETEKADKELTVIIRGTTLTVALLDHKEMFKKLCLKANTVICCRVTPAQKAELVGIVRDEGFITLAIGDGGNDVAMIQEAHVGVGIRGKEGLQAARAADYTISYFSALLRLVFVHGRYSYYRTCLVAQYSFYKSLMFCTIQIGFAFVSDYSGNSLFNSLCITIYNAALFVPIVTFTLDKDIGFQAMMENPDIYKDGQQSKYFNFRTFAYWCARAVAQGMALFMVTVFSRGAGYHYPKEGYGQDWETLGIVAFGAYLWVQAITMCLELKSLTMPSLVAIWGMHALTFVILIGTNALITFDSLNGYYIVFVAMGDPLFWLHNMLVTGICLIPLVAYRAYMLNYEPTKLDRLRYKELTTPYGSAGTLQDPLLASSHMDVPEMSLFRQRRLESRSDRFSTPRADSKTGLELTAS